MPEGEPLQLEVSAAGQKPQRLVVAGRGEIKHRDRINTDSSTSRDRFIKKLVIKMGVERDLLAPLIDMQLTKLADEIDERARASAGQAQDEAQSQATLAADMAAD